MKEKLWQGIFAALTTPFEQEELALDFFRQNIARYNQTALAGYVVLGSTGEAVFLSPAEAEAMVDTARNNIASGKKLIVGASRESAKEAVAFINRMADLGAEAALVKPPYYYKSRINRDSLKAFYFRVADEAKIPLIIYHIPQNTGIPLDAELVMELATHPQISGIKDSSGSLALVGEVAPYVKPSFCFLTGAGNIVLPSLQMGASGGILAVASVIPEICCSLYELFQSKRIEEALEWQLKIIPLNKVLTRTRGIAAVKYSLDLLGFYGGLPRLPLLPLDDPGKKEVASLLKKLGLI